MDRRPAGSFVATASEREQIHEAVIACDNTGRLLAFKDHFFYETGAFIPYGLNTPFVTATHFLAFINSEFFDQLRRDFHKPHVLLPIFAAPAVPIRRLSLNG